MESALADCLPLSSAVGQDLIYSAYGVETKSKDDPLIATIEHGLEAGIESVNPGAFLVDLISIRE